MTAKYEGLRSIGEQRVGFPNSEMAPMMADGLKATQKQNASLMKARQLARKVQCVSGLA